jgi:hypothetical protein
MSRRRQDVLRIYLSPRNPFHAKIRTRIAALKRELGMSESEAGMHLLLQQVLDDSEKKIAGVVPDMQPAAACNASAVSRSDRIQTGDVSPLDQKAYCGDGTAVIAESAVERILSDPGADTTVPDNNLTDSITQSVEHSLPRRARWSSLGRTSKSASND